MNELSDCFSIKTVTSKIQFFEETKELNQDQIITYLRSNHLCFLLQPYENDYKTRQGMIKLRKRVYTKLEKSILVFKTSCGLQYAFSTQKRKIPGLIAKMYFGSDKCSFPESKRDLGYGGSKIAFLAEDLLSGKEIVFSVSPDPMDKEFLTGQKVRDLSHCCPLDSYGSTKSNKCFAISRFCDSDKFHKNQKLQALLQLAETLAALHERGFIHGDLADVQRSNNVIYGENGCNIIDFGKSKIDVTDIKMFGGDCYYLIYDLKNSYEHFNSLFTVPLNTETHPLLSFVILNKGECPNVLWKDFSKLIASELRCYIDAVNGQSL